MRRGWIVALAAVLATAGLAGCIGSEQTTNQGPEAEDADETAFVPPVPDEDPHGMLPVDHPDHQNPDSHTQGLGLAVAGHTDFSELYGMDDRAGWTEVDIQGHLAAVASYKDDVGAVLVDITDPASPEPLSLVPSTGVDQDARLSEDVNYLFVSCQPSERNDAGGLAGDCTTDEPTPGSERSDGIAAYDVTDPTQPELVAFVSGVNTHNVWTDTIDGDIYVFTNGVEILRFTPSAGEGERFEQVAEAPGGHDAFVDEHPITGNPTLYTGSGNSFAIYDVSDPTQPEVLTEQGPDVTGWHEQTAGTQLVDGRALLVVGGEVFEDAQGTTDGSDPPMISVINVTDPTQPEVLSQWTLPVDELPGWTNYRWSPHNIDVSPHGQVAVAWNHGGIWVFDVSTQERQEDPVTLGFYQPHEDPVTRVPTFKATGDPAIPRVWGGMFDHHGHLVTADMYTGFYMLEPDWGLYG